MRQVRVVRIAVEGELEDPRPGYVELVAESGHVRRDHPRSSAMNGRPPSSFWTAVKNSAPGRAPTGPLGRRRSRLARARPPRSRGSDPGGSRRRGPAGRAVGRCTSDSRFDEGLPVVDRVAPELPVRAEVVGRHAGDEARLVVSSSRNNSRVGPDVARVGGDEKRQIADQAHAPGMGVLLEACPLAEQQELGEANLIDRVRQLSRACARAGRFAPDQLGRPLEVMRAVVSGLQRAEQGVVVQPVRLVVAELLKGGPQVRTRPRAEAGSRPFRAAGA